MKKSLLLMMCFLFFFPIVLGATIVKTDSPIIITPEKDLLFVKDQFTTRITPVFDAGGIDGISYLTPWFVQKGINVKYGYNVSIPLTPEGMQFSAGLQSVSFILSGVPGLEATRVGARYLHSVKRLDSTTELLTYVTYDFSDLSQVLHTTISVPSPDGGFMLQNRSVPYTVITFPDAIKIIFDVRQFHFLPGQEIVLDPTITINNVYNYTSVTNNVTVEPHPLAHITMNNSADLLLYYPFDVDWRQASTPNTTYDYSGYFSGGFTSDGLVNPEGSDYVNSYIGTGINFTGGFGGISLTIETSSTSYAFSFWRYRTGGSDGYMFDADSPRFILGEGLNCDVPGTFCAYDGSAWRSSSVLIPEDSWSHLGLVMDATNNVMLFYINGTNVANQTYAPETLGTTTSAFCLGNYQACNTDFTPIIGGIDEFMIYNRTISPNEMKSLFHNTMPRYRGPPATQRFDDIDILQNGSLNNVNVTTSTALYNMTNMTLMILEYNSTGTNTANSTLHYLANGTQTNTFTISATTKNISLLINYSSESNYFYSPILKDNITIISFQSASNASNATSNASPILVTVTLTAMSNNQTLIASANATDADNDTITYFWRLFRNNTLVTTGFNGTFTQGILKNFNNFSTNSVDGTYIVEVTANDSLNWSNVINSSGVTVTFPGNATSNASNNSPPVMVNASLTITSDNTTLLFYANATDNDTSLLTFRTWINITGTISDLGSVANIPQGVFTNYQNYTVTVSGNYSIIVMATDGFNNSDNASSNTVAVTLPEETMIITFSAGSILLILFILSFIFAAIFINKSPFISFICSLIMIIYGLYMISQTLLGTRALSAAMGILITLFGIGVGLLSGLRIKDN